MIDSTMSARIGADYRRYKNLKRIDAMHAAYGAGPEGRTCGECHQCHRPVEAPYMCREAWLHRMAYGKWHRFWPACGRWRE